MLAALLAAPAVLAAQPVWIAPPPPPAPDATPSWVWFNPPAGSAAPTPAGAPKGRGWLTRTVDLPAGRRVVRAHAALAADNRAELSVNGAAVLSARSWASPAHADLPAERLGGPRVTLVLSADNGAPGQPAPAVDPAGVCLLLVIALDDGSTLTVTTDGGWAGQPAAEGQAAPDPSGYTPAVVLGPCGAAPWSLRAAAFLAPAPPPRMRRVLTLPEAPTTAVVRVVGLGHYELRCNGYPVGDSVVNQAWSQYDKTLYVQTFELAPYLRKGENVLAATLGDSFWRVGPVNDPGRFSKTDAEPDFSDGQPYLLWIDGSAQAGGATIPIATDAAWTTGPSPLTFSHLYAGEDFDARLDTPGWDKSPADLPGWRPVVAARTPAGVLTPLPSPAVRAFEMFPPARVLAVDDRTFTYVFPQNCSSLLRFTVEGKAGDRVRFRPCEYMQPDGRVKFTYTWGTGKDIWQDYTLRGGGNEQHQTLFCYAGAQYVQVEGAVPEGRPNPGGLPVLRSLELVHVRAACEEAGNFACSSALQNGAERLIDWSIRSNMSWVPTDCPHREKNGWLEQDWHMARALSYRYDIRGWFTKTCRDIRDAQISGGPDDGFVPTNAPWYLVGRPRHDMFNDAPEWGISAVLVPWHLYEWYGDRGPLESNYASMKRHVDYLGRTAKDGLVSSNLGDWYDYGHGKGDGPSQWTPAEVSATAVWALGLRTVADAARVLGRPEDEAAYRARFEDVRRTFLAKLYDPATKTVKNMGSCQAGNAAALCVGLIPEADRGAAAQRILEDLEERGWQQTPGEVLQVFLVRALAETPEGARALHRVYARTAQGSYGYMVQSGLTTLPESWDARPGTGNSMTHFMLGHLMEWHYADVAGIRQAPGSVGWKRVLIAPQPPAPASPEAAALSSASARFESPAGLIASSWKVAGGVFTLACAVPAGVEAEAVLPDGSRRALPAGATELTCPWR